VVLTADSILARSTRRRQTSTGWNTAYIGANRYTLPPDEKPPADDALHPMAFLVEKGPGAVTRPHFHQADQFQVVVAGRGMLGDHEFSDGAVHYTDAYSAYGPIVAGKSGIWWFTLRNRWDPGARYMPAEREVLNAARDRHQHWELTTEVMPAALLGELCEATAVSCRPVLEAEDGLAGWRYRIPPCTAIAGRAPSAGGGQFWLVLAGDAGMGMTLRTRGATEGCAGSSMRTSVSGLRIVAQSVVGAPVVGSGSPSKNCTVSMLSRSVRRSNSTGSAALPTSTLRMRR